jgi:hypothetical protein
MRRKRRERKMGGKMMDEGVHMYKGRRKREGMAK